MDNEIFLRLFGWILRISTSLMIDKSGPFAPEALCRLREVVFSFRARALGVVRPRRKLLKRVLSGRSLAREASNAEEICRKKNKGL